MNKKYSILRVPREFKDLEKTTAAALGYPTMTSYQEAVVQARKLGNLKINVPRYEEFKFGIKKRNKHDLLFGKNGI